MLRLPGGRRKGEERLIEAVCQIRFDASLEKTRLVEFGLHAEELAKRQGKKPSTFGFLGFTYLCARSRRGKFTVHARTTHKRLSRGLTSVGRWCQEHRHAPLEEQQKTLNAKLRGHYQYHGRPTNFLCLWKFYRGTCRLALLAQSSNAGSRLTWAQYNALLRRYPLLLPLIYYPGLKQ